MVVAVASSRDFDDLVQVTDFHSPATSRRRLVSDADKCTILIESSFRSPIRIVEMVEQFVPPNQQHVRVVREVMLHPEKLSESQARVIAGFDKPLLKSRAMRNLPVIKDFRPRPLLPDTVLVEFLSRDCRSANPSVAGPDSRSFVESPADARTHNALVKTVGVI